MAHFRNASTKIGLGVFLVVAEFALFNYQLLGPCNNLLGVKIHLEVANHLIQHLLSHDANYFLGRPAVP